MKNGLHLQKLVCLVFLSLVCCHLMAQNMDYSVSNQIVREQLSMDNGWRFYKGDIPFPEIKGHGMSYEAAKAGKSYGAAAPEFDDTEWPVVNLPHDWAVESPFDSTANISQGYRPRGYGWYRKHFKLSPQDKGKHLELQIEGVSTFCTVWFNGTLMHRNFCGYTSFYIDISAMAKYGDDLNTISIRVDAVAQEGWWYEGAGMYRHTWLVKRAPLHIITDGVFAQPILKENKWTIPVEATVENNAKGTENYTVQSVVYDKAGKEIARGSNIGAIAPLAQQTTNYAISVANPTLWTLEKPALYTIKTTLLQNNQAGDAVTTTCGFRTFRFSADSGFFLNDVNIKIKGTCNHQDHAGIGTAIPYSIWDFRLRRLKEMGSNALRCSHNPPPNEMLDAADRMGLLVMDENRNFNISPEYQRQLQWMVKRDRNHPSIILWSVFNEEAMQGTENGYEMVRRMSSYVKALDTTRPVTAAQSGGQMNPINVSQAVDVVGFNYQMGSYDAFHKKYPNKPLTSSEDASGLMDRGEYATNKKLHTIEAYDNQKPGWGSLHRVVWKAINTRPFMAGCFTWTGFDYRGEPTPSDWPTISSHFGIMDLCGFPKTAFYLHQAQWIDDKPILQLFPHWNMPTDSIGKNIRVMTLTNADKVKLFLNGKLVADSVIDRYEMMTCSIPYQPGKLEAIGYKNGKEVSRFVEETTGTAVAIQLVPDRNSITGDGQDAIPVTFQTVDSKGRVVPTANNMIHFDITGDARIIGLGNGNPNCHEPEKGNQHSLYNGLGQVIIQSNAKGKGVVTLTATGQGLKPATVTLALKEAATPPFVPAENSVLILDKWKLSPAYTTKPDPNKALADFDQNSWTNYKPGGVQTLNEGGFAIYRTSFKPYASERKNGGTLVLKDVVGKAEVYLDKTLIGTKTTAEKGTLTITFPAGDAERKLNVLIESGKENKAGLGGVVTVKSL